MTGGRHVAGGRRMDGASRIDGDRQFDGGLRIDGGWQLDGGLWMGGGGGEPVVVLTVAGSDSGGGAGIQADLRTFAAHRAYGCSVVTAVTAQDTTGVHGVLPVPPDFVDRQLAAVLGDLPVRAVKTGTLGTAATVRVVAARASAGELPNLVVDPVLVATSGDRLSDVDSMAVIRDELLPHATVATPNAAEAGALLGRDVTTVEEMAAAAADLGRTGARCVVVTGGEPAASNRSGTGNGYGAGGGMACDAVWCAGEVTVLRSPWVGTRNTHGTGCTFSAAVAVGLGRGMAPVDAVRAAKGYLDRALRSAAGWHLGAGHGPVDHLVATEVGPNEVGPNEVGPGWVDPAEVDPREVDPREVGLSGVGPGEGGPGGEATT